MSKTDMEQLNREMRQLMRCMDFVSRHPSLNKPGRAGKRMAEVYQQLGRAWELLALRCSHRNGWRKRKDGTLVCGVCGTLKGHDDRWLLLPRQKRKVIGRMTRPTTGSVLPSRSAATVLKDEVTFHGARLGIEVLNAHKSRLFRSRMINVAADRLVELREGDIVCKLDEHTLRVRFGKRVPGQELPFGSLVSELPRQILKSCPVMVETDRNGRFVGLIVFKPGGDSSIQTKMD